MFPVSPPLGALRLATIQDVPRIAVVATSGFYYSPVFSWERPYHQEFPRDTFMSYEKMFADIIRSPDYVAVVVEDSFDPNEATKSGATIDPDTRLPTHDAGEKVIVGVATWKFEPDSERRGQFLDPDDNPNLKFSRGLGRDKKEWRVEQLDADCDAAEKKHLSGDQLMDMVVVHPAYWKRGHGTTLVKWGMSMADLDHVDQGVVAAKMGEQLYLKLGYTKLAEVHVCDDKEPADVTVGILEYCYRPRFTIESQNAVL
ncbi:hypothetical protein O1611_g4452 [Lasiodiplodia mahajangana]|uniref:Uncharacterized protein n=1 Tax=Lasiodiplodia mahajangana TaxID=1108764 RepID=A0ACC2JNX8_9PEZI|nr:hypothetical protein O1611_g4452 [Lasiodiplodia mahajangana]